MSKITQDAQKRCACHTLQEQLAEVLADNAKLKHDLALAVIDKGRVERRLHSLVVDVDRRARLVEDIGGPD
jgi:hypothetical protein